MALPPSAPILIFASRKSYLYLRLILRLDKFLIEYYPNGSIKDWKSTLTIIENQKEKITKTIEVNHPLSYQGFRFYQSSYGWDWKNLQLQIEIKKRSNPQYSHPLTLVPGQPQNAPDNLTLVVTHFVPDFIITQSGQITTRSLEPHNPATFIQVKQGQKNLYTGWIFARFADFSLSQAAEPSDYHFLLKDVQAEMYSGIQIAKDPGTNFIWAGCIFLGLGLFLAFYWPPREIWGLIENHNGVVNIHLGGVASKNKETLIQEFTRLIREIRGFK